MPLDASFKPKKGGAKENVHSDLTHILGYTGTDMEAGPPSPVGSEKETAGTGRSYACRGFLISPVISLMHNKLCIGPVKFMQLYTAGSP